jgi:hypothetical protein
MRIPGVDDRVQEGGLMQGSLREFSPGELIQILGFLAKSGVLRFRSSDEEGLIAFRGGKVIFAAAPSVRQSLGSRLLARELISAEELTEALAMQTVGSEKTRLGTILVEMGVLDQDDLERVVKEQFSTVISEFIDWDDGTYEFEVKELADRGEVELEAADFIAVSGVESTHVLLDAARQADERAAAEVPPAAEPDSLDLLVDKVTSPTIRGETVYRLLDLGSDTCGRCLLFAVHPARFHVVGHVVLEQGRATVGEQVSSLEIPREGESILARAAEQRHSILSRLAESGEDGRILEALGGPSPSKSVAIPLSDGGQVILVLYGDHLPEDLGTGRLEELEIAVTNAVAQDDAGQPGS